MTAHLKFERLILEYSIEALVRLEVFSYFLGPLWALWLGIVLVRSDPLSVHYPEKASAALRYEGG